MLPLSACQTDLSEGDPACPASRPSLRPMARGPGSGIGPWEQRTVGHWIFSTLPLVTDNPSVSCQNAGQ